jgi:hypothetical protein
LTCVLAEERQSFTGAILANANAAFTTLELDKFSMVFLANVATQFRPRGVANGCVN